MKLNAKEVLKPTFILVAICLVMTACLVLTNVGTKDAIAAQNEKAASESRKVALPDADTFEQSPDSDICFLGKKGNDVVGYVFNTTASSYGGPIQVMTGISKDGKVTGVVLVSTNDTPGLGLNAQKPEFRDQYKQQAPDNGFEVVKGGGAKDGQINAMTGATISSKAVTTAVNEAVAEYQKMKDGV